MRHGATRLDHDPATRSWPFIALIALSVIGLLIAGYLTYTHVNSSALVCSVGDCGSVQKSEYSRIGPIPIALFGMGMFVALGALAFARWRGIGPFSFAQYTVAAWSIVFAGVLYYVYLTFLEIWVIHAICQYCVASSIATLGIFGIESSLLWRVLGDE
jgi:uncharacterized membrane protein